MVQETSLLAYEELQETFHKDADIVYAAIKAYNSYDYYPTDRELAKFLMWECGRVSARRNDLIKNNRVIVKGKKKKSGRLAYCWKTV